MEQFEIPTNVKGTSEKGKRASHWFQGERKKGIRLFNQTRPYAYSKIWLSLGEKVGGEGIGWTGADNRTKEGRCRLGSECCPWTCHGERNRVSDQINGEVNTYGPCEQCPSPPVLHHF